MATDTTSGQTTNQSAPAAQSQGWNGMAIAGFVLALLGLFGIGSLLGIIFGAVAGLVAITPASGFVGPTGALIIGIAAGVICAWSATWLKPKLGYDDSLDAFGVHGVGGFVGFSQPRGSRRVPHRTPGPIQAPQGARNR